MGVTKLWPLLSDVCQDLSLSSLNGSTLAVDLSQWICELQNIKIAQQLSNLYLRNLFFRTTNLMQHGIKLVFVEDGTAPEMKKAEMAKRNNFQGVSLDRVGMKQRNLKCRELFYFLGLPCIQSTGEAEKLCAQLNTAGKVDGVYSADGDAFLYGAKKVYRNLEKKKDTICCFNMEDIKDKLSLDRHGLITIALFSGCDYGKKGVHNVGIEKANAFVQYCNKLQVDPLNRIKEWRKNSNLENLQKIKDSPLKKPPHCSVCRHLGTKPDHLKSGCNPCDTDQSCDSKNQVICECDNCAVENKKTELSLREKALKNPDFPDQQIMEEFLEDDCNLPEIQWSSVNVNGLKSFLKENLKWNDNEFYNKTTTILVNLQLNGMDWAVAVADKIKPEKIVRRTKQKPSCVVVLWKRLDTDNVTEVTVLESSFKLHFPKMLDDFDREKEKEKQQQLQEKKTGRKRKTDQGKLTDLFQVKKKAKQSPPYDGKP